MEYNPYINGMIMCPCCDGHGIINKKKLCKKCGASGKISWIDNIGFDRNTDPQNLFDFLAQANRPTWAYQIRISYPNLSEDVREYLEQIICHDSEWSYDLRFMCKDLSENTKRMLERVILQDCRLAYRLRMRCKEILSSELIRAAEEVICQDAYLALCLRCNCNLSDEIRIMAEEAIRRDSGWTYQLRDQCTDLSPESIELIDEAICRDPKWACHLLMYSGNISDRTKEMAIDAISKDLRWNRCYDIYKEKLRIMEEF